MEYATEKWGGHPHYRSPVTLLGDDEHGSWLWGPKGRTVMRGDEFVFTTEQDAIALVPPGAWWALSWWIGHPEIELYVNINTPARKEVHRFVSVDLDLDVVRYLDGRVEIVDRDEFELHQVRYDYPDHLIDAAEARTAEAYELTCRNEPPFDGIAAMEWAERARGMA